MDINPAQLGVHLDMHATTVTMHLVRCSCGQWVRERGPGVDVEHRQHIVDTLFDGVYEKVGKVAQVYPAEPALAHERMANGTCPECGEPPKAHGDDHRFWVPGNAGCSLLERGVLDRIEQYEKDHPQ